MQPCTNVNHPIDWRVSGDGSDGIHKPVLGLIGLIIANQSSLQRKVTVQERHLQYIGRPTFSLAPQWRPHFFHSRIATDSQAAEEAIPHLYKQEQQAPRPVRRLLSWTKALLGRATPGQARNQLGSPWGAKSFLRGAQFFWTMSNNFNRCPMHFSRGGPCSGGWVPGMKMHSLVGLSAHSAFHWWSVQCAERTLLSDEMMSCYAVDTNGCVDLRRHASALDGRVSAEWNRCPGSTARRPRDRVAPLRRSSAGWMPARIVRLSTDVGRKHTATIRMASLMAGSLRWCCRYLHCLELLRQAQEKDGNSGYWTNGKATSSKRSITDFSLCFHQPPHSTISIATIATIDHPAISLYWHEVALLLYREYELRSFGCGDYHSDLLCMGTI